MNDRAGDALTRDSDTFYGIGNGGALAFFEFADPEAAGGGGRAARPRRGALG